MGLDQYAYVAARSGQRDEFYEEGRYENNEWVSPKEPARELAYWRKHPNLQGWMAELYRSRGGDAEQFNGVELELTWEDLDDLEFAITNQKLPTTRGFFFGDPSDEHYLEQDLEFIRNARAELFLGLKVFYNSSW